MTHPIYFIIPAGGVGTRMNSHFPKQYLKLRRQTILETTLNIFLESSMITGGVVGIASTDKYYDMLHIQTTKPLWRTEGGETRARTVYQCLLHLKEHVAGDPWVLVHDAARPGLTPEQLDQFITLIENDEVGGIMAMPATDTIKIVDHHERVAKTIERHHVWLAQTPQMFRLELLTKSLKYCFDHSIEVTDESSAIEACDLAPKVVMGHSNNFKITYPEDLDKILYHLKE